MGGVELESQHKALSSTTLKKSTPIKDASNNGDDAAEENDSDGVVKQTIKQKDKSGVTEQKSKSKDSATSAAKRVRDMLLNSNFLAGSSVRSLTRRIQWAGLDLGEALPLCRELEELDNTMKTLDLSTHTLSACFKLNFNDEDIQKVIDAMLRGERSAHTRWRAEKSGMDMYTNEKITAMRDKIVTNLRGFEWSKSLDDELTRMINLAGQKLNTSSLKVRMNDAINAWKEGTDSTLINSLFPK